MENKEIIRVDHIGMRFKMTADRVFSLKAVSYTHLRAHET